MVTCVTVCVCTYRRAYGLQRLLGAIGSLAFHKVEDATVSVVVVDNEALAPLRAMVSALADDYPFPLIYTCEPLAGLASARNRALRTVPAETEYIAFIDDDEVPEPQWLDELLAVSRRFNAPIVRGPVKPIFAQPPPAWMVQGRFFEEGPFRDGEVLRFAATNNALIRAEVIRALHLSFDMRFNRTGGEDQDFFGRAIRAGYRTVGSEHALVHEAIPEERMRLAWLLKRRFRMGNTLTMVDSIRRTPAVRMLRIPKAGGRIALGALQMLGAPALGKRMAVRGLCNVSWGMGSLCGFLGLIHNEYEPTRMVPTNTKE